MSDAENGAGHALESVFHPRSIAIAGVSSKPRSWGSGDAFVRALQAMRFPGPIYPVNPKIAESNGLPCYPSLQAIEGPVDHLISAVPAPALPGLLEDAIAKGVRSVHSFTSGFRETGHAERADLEQEVLRMVRESGIRLIGPNCMGLYCPRTGLSFDEFAPKRPGDIGMLSQSGTHAEDLMNGGALRGLRFSKIVSYGNALDLNECDFLDYFGWDPQTRVITAYVEGPRDGRRFFETMRRVAAIKPVLLLKGGQTEAGQRAIRSHTGSLAGQAAVWRAFERQAGFLMAETLEQLEDLTVAFRFLGAPTAPGAALVGSGGGMAVVGADAAARGGLDVPALAPATQEALGVFTPIAGASVRNPVDTPVTYSEEQLAETLRLAAADPGIGVVLYHTWLRDAGRGDTIEDVAERTRRTLLSAREATGTPIGLSLHGAMSGAEFDHMLLLVRKLAEVEIPVFPSIYRATWALGRWMAWHRERESGLHAVLTAVGRTALPAAG